MVVDFSQATNGHGAGMDPADGDSDHVEKRASEKEDDDDSLRRNSSSSSNDAAEEEERKLDEDIESLSREVKALQGDLKEKNKIIKGLQKVVHKRKNLKSSIPTRTLNLPRCN